MVAMVKLIWLGVKLEKKGALDIASQSHDFTLRGYNNYHILMS